MAETVTYWTTPVGYKLTEGGLHSNTLHWQDGGRVLLPGGWAERVPQGDIQATWVIRHARVLDMEFTAFPHQPYVTHAEGFSGSVSEHFTSGFVGYAYRPNPDKEGHRILAKEYRMDTMEACFIAVAKCLHEWINTKDDPQ